MAVQMRFYKDTLKQLWAYLNGTKPRKLQRERIARGLHSFSEELRSIFP